MVEVVGIDHRSLKQAVEVEESKSISNSACVWLNFNNL